MADPRAFAEVILWGSTLGGVVELDDGAIVFEYDPDFRTSGLEVSPVHLPLSTRGPVRFEELRRKPAFRGLPGLLADALPDAFGTTVIRAYYTARGEVEKAFSPVQHLLYVGDRAMGALRFQPAEALPQRAAEAEALEVAALVADARRIISGDADVAIPELFRIGSSAGGMRPKAVVLFDPGTREVRSAFADPGGDDIQAILKFDGVGPDASGSLADPQPFNRIEAAYARMARDAGLDAVTIEVLESDEGHAHLVIPRFDRTDEGGIHQHTLGGLLHVDYDEPGASSYEEYLRTMLTLGMPPADIIEGFRRMVFNVLAVNQDDHVKNLSFQMDRSGTWSPTPAYDLTFARGQGFTSAHQMRINGKRSNITRGDLLAVADTFGIRNPDGVIDGIADVVARWPEYARQLEVPESATRRVGDALRVRAAEVA